MSHATDKARPFDASEPVGDSPALALAHGSARLANDIARCNGSGSIEDGVQYWREGCEHCLRRTAARPKLVWMMAPPPIIAFECEYFLPPNVEISHGGRQPTKHFYDKRTNAG